MFCKFCGSKLTDDAKFCPNCGSNVTSENSSRGCFAQQPSQSQQAQPTSQPKQDNPAQTMAILGLVFAFVFSLVGLILSAIALKKYKEQTIQDGKGLATAGLIVSIIASVFYVLYFVLAIAVVLIG